MTDKLYRQEAQKILGESEQVILALLERVKVELGPGFGKLEDHLREAEEALSRALSCVDELPDNIRVQQIREAREKAGEKYREMQRLKTHHYNASTRSEKIAITKQIKAVKEEYEALEAEYVRLRDAD